MTELPQELKRFHKRSLFAADKSPYGVSIICYQYGKRLFKEADTVEEVDALIDGEEFGKYSIGFFILPNGQVMGRTHFIVAWMNTTGENKPFDFTNAHFPEEYGK